MKYRVFFDGEKHIPQFTKWWWSPWQDVDTSKHLFKEYSGKGTFVNAKQNLYEFVCKGQKCAIMMSTVIGSNQYTFSALKSA